MANSTFCGSCSIRKWGPISIPQPIQGHVGFARLPNAADPVLSLGKFLRPRVRGRDHQNTPSIQPLMDGLQERLRIGETIEQIDGQDQVVSGERWLEVGCIALEELDAVSAARASASSIPVKINRCNG